MRIGTWLLALVLGCGPVHAADWTVQDLGRLHKNDHCMQAAARTFQAMLGEARIERLHHRAWVSYADGINGNHDALITCTHGEARGTRATLVIHTQARRLDAHLLARRIDAIFQIQAKRVTRAWRDSFNTPS